MQEQHGTNGAGGIAQGSHGNDETHVFDGEHRQKRKEGQRHHCDTKPHPTHAHRAENETHERSWPEVVNFADHLHCAGHTELTARACGDNNKKE
ncbi:MAG: hypothetical protein DMG49_02815 [Acidobacteria bacterium]|nr:MAG: hypothetical protein DMG49_02815 [Acidobacteriota bacterium]